MLSCCRSLGHPQGLLCSWSVRYQSDYQCHSEWVSANRSECHSELVSANRSECLLCFSYLEKGFLTSWRSLLVKSLWKSTSIQATSILIQDLSTVMSMLQSSTIDCSTNQVSKPCASNEPYRTPKTYFYKFYGYACASCTFASQARRELHFTTIQLIRIHSVVNSFGLFIYCRMSQSMLFHTTHSLLPSNSRQMH